jgi:threonine/homoserine/homoserine lactone efflux protein
MISTATFSAFIPTFFLVSATPGMCMTLALTLGMTIGLRRTLWMMAGELVGVALVSVSVVIGIAAVLLHYPSGFLFLKYGGGAYLTYLGLQLWRSRGRMAIQSTGLENPVNRSELALQGFITAVANPKAWAFMVSLLPPFINPDQPLAPQLFILLSLILSIEFICLLSYAGGGKTLRCFLDQSGNVRRLNRVSAVMLIGVAIWLILD